MLRVLERRRKELASQQSVGSGFAGSSPADRMKAGDHPFDYVPFRPVQRLGKKQMLSHSQAVDEQAVEQGLDKAQSLSDVRLHL